MRHARLEAGRGRGVGNCLSKRLRDLLTSRSARTWLPIIDASGRLHHTRRPLMWRQASPSVVTGNLPNHSGPQGSLTACLTFARCPRLSAACRQQRRRYSLASAVGATPQISVLSSQWYSGCACWLAAFQHRLCQKRLQRSWRKCQRAALCSPSCSPVRLVWLCAAAMGSSSAPSGRCPVCASTACTPCAAPGARSRCC